MSLVDVVQGSIDESPEIDISITEDEDTGASIIRLSAKNARMLCALADFPEWAAQPRAVAKLLEELFDALVDAGFDGSQSVFGFVPKTSLDALDALDEV